MSVFTKEYFRMTEADVIEYCKTELDFFDDDAELSCKEIGDGNMNFVFRVVDEKNNKSIIIKQAGPTSRIDTSIKVSPDRNRIEYELLKTQGELAPGLVPEVYKYDPVMNCFAMEDLSDYEMMRTALMNYRKFPEFADHITTFLANTLLMTSDVVMDHKEKKEMVKKFINPDLCEITEDLVYTEPFYDCERNRVFPGTREFIAEHIWNDEKLKLEAAKMKFDFMTNAQCLIHGDLHTGSIFVKEDSTKVFDPEFAFYGPAGFDVGKIISNLIFAYAHAKFTLDDPVKRDDYLNYLETTIVDVVDLFKKKFLKLFDEKATERVAKYKGFKEYYLDSILRDASGVAGLSLCRRIIGLAQVKDITSIEDPEKRVAAEKACLLIAKKFIFDRDKHKTGLDFLRVIKEYM